MWRYVNKLYLVHNILSNKHQAPWQMHRNVYDLLQIQVADRK